MCLRYQVQHSSYQLCYTQPELSLNLDTSWKSPLIRRLRLKQQQDARFTLAIIDRDAVDEEGDGDISKEEFVRNAMKSKFIFNMLKE